MRYFLGFLLAPVFMALPAAAFAAPSVEEYKANRDAFPEYRLIYGRVLDEHSGKPIRGATIAVSHSSQYAKTNLRGRFKMVVRDTEVTEIYANSNWYGFSETTTVPAYRKWVTAAKMDECRASFEKGTKKYRRCIIAAREKYLLSLYPEDGTSNLIYPKMTFTRSGDGGMYLAGKVVNAETGQAVPYAQVNASHSSINDRTDADGRFKMWLGATSAHRLYVMQGLTFGDDGSMLTGEYFQVSVPLGYTGHVTLPITVQ
jgi:hypothetical protein